MGQGTVKLSNAQLTYFSYRIDPTLYSEDNFDVKGLVDRVLKFYLYKPHHKFFKEQKHPMLMDILKALHQERIEDKVLVERLKKLHTMTQSQQDTEHLHIALTILKNLLESPDFRDEMRVRHEGQRNTSPANFSNS